MEQARMKDPRIAGTRRKLSQKQRRHPGPALLERMQPDAAGHRLRRNQPFRRGAA
jgi:hypothetical protein